MTRDRHVISRGAPMIGGTANDYGWRCFAAD